MRNPSFQSVNSSTWEDKKRALTDIDLHKISRRIFERETLRSLANELKIETTDVKLAFVHYKDDMYEATLEILNIWFSDEINTTDAFITMCEALSNIRKKFIIKAVLLKNNNVVSVKL